MNTREVRIGNRVIGGDNPVLIQSMTNTKTEDVQASNSCPDINVINCTTFNNESYNIALYTNSAKNTDFSASSVYFFMRLLSHNSMSCVLDLTGDFFSGCCFAAALS